MRRGVLVIAWLVGSTVPLSLAAVFLFGCCVLPFHQQLHKVAPLCAIASQMTRGDHHQGDPNPASTPEDKRESAKKNVPTKLSPRTFLAANDVSAPAQLGPSTVFYRSFISLGAVRCDVDVGTRLSLLDVFRI